MKITTECKGLRRGRRDRRRASVLQAARHLPALAPVLVLWLGFSSQIQGCGHGSETENAFEAGVPVETGRLHEVSSKERAGKVLSTGPVLETQGTDSGRPREGGSRGKDHEAAEGRNESHWMGPISRAKSEKKNSEAGADHSTHIKAEPIDLDDIHPLRIASDGGIIPLAPMGKKEPGPSPLENSPGYELPPDPERHTVETGRREVTRRDVSFETGAASIDELAILILEGLRTGDRDLLKSLRVNYGEFSEILWPEFPQSRPATNLQPGNAWFFLDRESAAGMARAIRRWEGRHFSLERIEYEKGFAPYTNFNLLHGIRLHVREQNGELRVLPFAESFAECGGRWKVYTYRD